MVIQCVVACQGFDGPALYFIKVDCTEEEYNNGQHYDRAAEAAENEGYESGMVVFDENDGPDALFNLFNWDTASTVKV